MEVKLDKNIPIPEAKGGRGKLGRYSGMEVGDSVFLAMKPNEASGRFSCYRKSHGWKTTTRTVTENGVKGTRVWRTE